MKTTLPSFLFLGLSAGVAAVVSAEEPLPQSRSWRFTAGPAVNFGVRADITVSPAHAASLFSKSTAPTGASRDSARSSGDALNLGTGRVDFPDGGFIDPSDSAGIAGETWNWYMPAGSLDAEYKASFLNPYAGGSVSESAQTLHGEDEADLSGWQAELDRRLWESGRFGVDLGLAFSYTWKDDFFQTSGVVGTRTVRTESGTYVTDVAFNQELLSDPWGQNPDGSWGSGSFDGPGMVLEDGDVSVTHHWSDEKRSSRSETLTMTASGDYRDIEAMLLARPYFDVAEWLRVQAVLGVAVSRADLDFDVTGQCAGRVYAKSESFDDCDVYGIAGLGAMLRYDRWCLGADALYRFLDDDIVLDGSDIRGTVERADWMVKAYGGVEF